MTALKSNYAYIRLTPREAKIVSMMLTHLPLVHDLSDKANQAGRMIESHYKKPIAEYFDITQDRLDSIIDKIRHKIDIARVKVKKETGQEVEE